MGAFPERELLGHSGWLRWAVWCFVLLCVGCTQNPRAWLGPSSSDASPPSTDLPEADTPFTPLSFEDTTPVRVDVRQRARADMYSVRLRALSVRVPRTERVAAGRVWRLLREDVLGQAARLRLRENGIRVGVGRNAVWGDVKQMLDSIEGVRVSELDPVLLPPGYPLALELDREARDQTLFVMEPDGILSGESWPRSRNALRVAYGLDVQQPERVLLRVVPEVRQRMPGWRWTRTEAGIVQEPKVNGRAFGVAGFSIPVGAKEFVLIAPNERADLYGLIGGAFLCDRVDGDVLDCYLFVRMDVQR